MVWKKGHVPWNKGLTKHTDKRVREYAKKMVGHPVSEKSRLLFINQHKGKHSWNYGLTKEIDERVAGYANKISESTKGRTPWNKGIPSCLKGKTFIDILGEQKANKISKIISDGKKGNKNPMKNPKHKESMMKALLQVSKTVEYRKRCSDAGKKGGVKACLSICKNKPYIWSGVHFMSRSEMEVAKKILDKPIVGVNCHVHINSKVFDFFPQENDLKFQGKFVEYHPFDFNKRTVDEYRKYRQQSIDNSSYKGREVIVITDLREVK